MKNMVTLDSYLSQTLHRFLNCKCNGNCLLKSFTVTNVGNGKAEIYAEPFDDAYDTNNFDKTLDKIERVLYRRRKSICKALGVTAVSVTVCNEYAMQAAYQITLKDDRFDRVA